MKIHVVPSDPPVVQNLGIHFADLKHSACQSLVYDSPVMIQMICLVQRAISRMAFYALIRSIAKCKHYSNLGHDCTTTKLYYVPILASYHVYI